MTNSLNTAKIIGFSNKSVYESIQNFLDDANFSDNTKNQYRSNIEYFFNWMFKGKSLTEITNEDLRSITNDDMKRYRNHLKRKELENSTVNNKIAAVTSLFGELAKDKERNLNPHVIKLKKLKEDQEHYGDFTREEVKLLIEEAKKLPNGLEKSLAIELSIKTSYRISYMLELTWNKIKKVDDIYVIKGRVGKKNEGDKTIGEEFYNRLLEIKRDNKYIFHNSEKNNEHMDRITFYRTVKTLIEKLNLDPDGHRNLTPHSLKNFGINEVYAKTKDIRMMAKQGNHSATTSLEYYSRLSSNPKDNPSLIVLEDIDDSKIKNSTLDELLKAIDQCSDNVKLEILSKLR